MSNAVQSRLKFQELSSSRRAGSIHPEVLKGLLEEPRSLPCKLFYDPVGSVLFEEICRLPEYYLTRTEQSILSANADAIGNAAGSPADVVELGSGSSSKTRTILDALLSGQAKIRYIPIDISADF